VAQQLVLKACCERKRGVFRLSRIQAFISLPYGRELAAIQRNQYALNDPYPLHKISVELLGPSPWEEVVEEEEEEEVFRMTEIVRKTVRGKVWCPPGTVTNRHHWLMGLDRFFFANMFFFDVGLGLKFNRISVTKRLGHQNHHHNIKNER